MFLEIRILKKWLETLSALLAGVALFAIMVLTFLDVGGRKLLSHSITGSLELTELLMVVVIFGALPLVSERGEHVVFDSLDPIIPEWLRMVQRALVHLLCASALLALGSLMWKTGNDFAATGETTAQLKILKAPFIYGMGLLCAFTGVVHLGLMTRTQDEQEGGAL